MQNLVTHTTTNTAVNDNKLDDEYPLKREDLVQMGVTPRQYEVLQQLAKGLTYKEIGKLLFVSENTIKFHCKALYKKFEINSRNELLYKLMMLVHQKKISHHSPHHQ